MNSKKTYSGFFWLPVLIFQGLWYLIKLMFLGMTHISDARECEKMLYCSPRKVPALTRKGIKLARIGQSLFYACALIVFILCMVNLQ